MTSPRARAAWVGAALLAAACAGDAGGRGEPEPEPLPATYPGKKIVFVTSTAEDGDLIGSWLPACSGRATGLEAADCICQEHATWGGLSGTYRAWLSDSTHSAASRLAHATVPYVNRLGVELASGWAALAALPCTELLTFTEDGGAATGTFASLIWTGSDADGAAHPDETCDDWTSGAIGGTGWTGSLPQGTLTPGTAGCWSEFGRRACDDWNRLLCFEQ